jgi:hypothetical protein
MHKRRSKQAAAIFVLAVFLLILPQTAFAAPPSVSVTIESPADGSTITLAAGETTADVPVSGKASVTPGDEAGKNTTLVYTMDRSSSMNTSAGVNCDGVPGNDTRIVCEKRAVGFANGKADDANSVVALAGVAAFSATGQVQDVNRSTAAVDALVAPEFDSADAGTTPDVVDAANAVNTFTGTNYSGGLTATFTILNDAANNQPHNLVIFMSDGRNNQGVSVTSLQGQVPANTLIKTFALGNEVDCNSRSTASGGLGSLQEVANLSTEGPGAGNTAGVCKIVTDMSKLGDEIATAISATLNSLTWTLNGGAQTAIPNSGIDPDLPQTAPKTVNWNFTANDLPEGEHKICVQAHGMSGATPLNAEDCVTITIVELDPCTAAFDDPGLLTDDTLAQTLWDGGLNALSPLTEDPDRDGIISQPLGDAFNAAPFDGTILETVLGDEVPCAIDLLLDENTFPVDL